MGAVLNLRPDPRLRLRLERPPSRTEPTPCLEGASEDQKMERFFGYEPARVASALKTCKTPSQKRMGFQTRRERRHFHRHGRSFELITEKVWVIGQKFAKPEDPRISRDKKSPLCGLEAQVVRREGFEPPTY